MPDDDGCRRNKHELVDGTVEKVIFDGWPKNAYKVLLFRPKRGRAFVAVGFMPQVAKGDRLSLSGEWTVHKTYGKQFSVDEAENPDDKVELAPADETRGIEAYLGSGIIKGVGPQLAERLVATFGKDFFKVVEKTPERLAEVDGIGEEKIRSIITSLEKQRTGRNTMLFLYAHGIRGAQARKIFKAFGHRTAKLLVKDPYRLMREVPGFGFLSADAAALSLGIPRDSQLRIRAAVEFVLSKAADYGDCCLELHMLRRRVRALVDVDNEQIAEAVEACEKAGAVAVEVEGDEKLVFLSGVQAAEMRLADRILNLLESGLLPVQLQNDVAGSVAEADREFGFRLASGQRRAVEAALQSKFLIITGGPGVGKTTIIRAILKALEKTDIEIALCAPTGRAAKRLSESCGVRASTIHRLLEANPKTRRFARDEINPLDCDLLIADEFSMVDLHLAEALFRAVPDEASVILVGDVDQLPSVGPGAVLADLIESGVVPVIRLDELFRQAAESSIVRVAHQINDGIMPVISGESDTGADCIFIERDTPEDIADEIVEQVASELPLRCGLSSLRDVQVLCPMKKGDIGTVALNRRLQKMLNPVDPGTPVLERFESVFSVGDKVMQIENDYEKQVFNGDIGFVSGLDAKAQTLEVDFDGHAASYRYEELDELGLCYAATIHKSQGSEFPAVVIPLAMQHYPMLERKLVYTAITRAKNFVVLVGQREALAMAVRGKQAERRMSGLKRRLQHPGSA